MIYVFVDYDEVEKVYEGPDLDLETLEADFELEFWGVEPFVPVDNPCGITSWRDGPRGECSCQGKACRQAHIAAWYEWNHARHKLIQAARERGVAEEFHTWLIEHYDLKPALFKTVQI